MTAVLGAAGPVVVVDEERARANIAFMADKARVCGVRLRPHFKTHRSPVMAGWFRDAGVTKATVSSSGMAGFFLAHGWRDLTLAFPANPGEIARLDALAAVSDLGLLADHPDVIAALDRGLGHDAGLWLKIDAGYGRAGVRWDDEEGLVRLAEAAKSARRLRCVGLLTHAGHSYRERGREGVLRVHEETLARMAAAREVAAGVLGRDPEISVGDTPTCTLADAFPGVAEIRPGNFVVYDLMQWAAGVCPAGRLALTLACPVVSVDPRRRRAVIHGGAVHFSRETVVLPDGRAVFALAREGDGAPEPGRALIELSQEHGVVSYDEGAALPRPGDVLRLVPAHACLACGGGAEARDEAGRPLSTAAPAGPP